MRHETVMVMVVLMMMMAMIVMAVVMVLAGVMLIRTGGVMVHVVAGNRSTMILSIR